MNIGRVLLKLVSIESHGVYDHLQNPRRRYSPRGIVSTTARSEDIFDRVRSTTQFQETGRIRREDPLGRESRRILVEVRRDSHENETREFAELRRISTRNGTY